MPALASANDIYRVRTSTQDIIKEALERLGVLGEGEVLSAATIENCLRTFNYMVDSWNTEKLIIYCLARTPFTLTAGTNPHEIGPGSSVLDAPRPNRIEQGQAWITGGGLGTDETELEVLTLAQWNTARVADQSGTPSELYYEPLFPLGNIWFDVKPDAAYTLVLWLEQMLIQVFMDGTTTELALPPGYAKALACNLAIELAPKYGKDPSASVIAGAVEGKANIKRLNMKPLYLKGDPALRTPRAYDITRGDL